MMTKRFSEETEFRQRADDQRKAAEQYEPDPWSRVEYAKIIWTPATDLLETTCKFRVEGKRCNAKFKGSHAMVKLAVHLGKMHGYKFSFPRRFSNRKEKGDGK